MPGLARRARLPSPGGSPLIHRLITAALVAALVVPGAAQAHPMPKQTAQAERYFAHRCAQSRPIDCIHRAALHWQVSYTYAKGISWRESRWLPYAKNPSSTASGLFQFLTSTWFGSWNPYRRGSIWSARDNSLAAAYAMHLGYYSWWAATA